VAKLAIDPSKLMITNFTVNHYEFPESYYGLSINNYVHTLHIHNSKADFSQPLDFYINELAIHVCIIANGSLICFSWGLFLRPVSHARVIGCYSNGSGLTGQATTQLD